MSKRRALSATFWSGGDLLARQGIQFVARLLLARLLTPEDFGLVAVLAFFVGAGAVLADGGLAVALIQRRDTEHSDESTVFWTNLALGASITVALVIAAPVIAAFLDQPRMVPLVKVSALAIAFGSLGSVHVALLSKQIDFRTQAIAGGVAALLSIVVALTLALAGSGVWALVWQAIVMSAAQTIMLWWLHPWRPATVFQIGSLRRLGSFSVYHLGSTLLEAFYVRLYALLLGRGFGAMTVGYYSNADAIRSLPSSFIGGLVGRVALPMFSAEAADPLRLRRGLQLSLRVSMLLNAPLMLGGVALSDPLVEVLLGRQWSPASPLVQILCLAGVFFPLHLLNLQALMARGYANLMFRLEMAKKLVGIALLFAGIPFGATGVAWSQVAFSLVAVIINVHYTRQFLRYGMKEQLWDCAAPVFASSVAAVVAFLVNTQWAAPALFRLLSLSALGAIVYVSLLLLMRAKVVGEAVALWSGR